jgi:pilus assembly protein CpaB
MRPKTIALLVLALGCGLVASIGITEVLARRNSDPAGATGDTQTIFVAMTDVGMGDSLTSQMLKIEQWPKGKIPAGAIARIEDIEGRRVRTRLYPGEPILENKLLSKGASEQGASALIPKGYRVVPVRVVDACSGGSNLILPGDRVDVMVHLVRDPNRGIHETITRTILQDAKVFGVNAVVDLEKEKDDKRSINAKTISLLVKPDQAAKVMLAQQMGTIQLVMRSPEDDQQTPNAQAKPSELFGIVDKSERSKETLMDAPDPALTAKGAGFTELLNSVPEKAAETWTVRIIQPGGVNDVVLEADDSKSASASPFGLWKTTAAASAPTGNPVPNRPKVSGVPAPMPTPPVPKPPAAPKKGEPKNDTKDLPT